MTCCATIPTGRSLASTTSSTPTPSPAAICRPATRSSEGRRGSLTEWPGRRPEVIGGDGRW